MDIMKEFRDFAVKGNVTDMAIGIIIGAAFGRIVTSLVADVIMPPLGLLVGAVDFSNLAVTLKQAVGDAPAVSIRYGVFIQTVFDFIIVVLAIFLVVKGMNSLKRKEEEAPKAPSAPPKEEILLTEIRDLLKSR